jgi:hypothetical protein
MTTPTLPVPKGLRAAVRNALKAHYYSGRNFAPHTVGKNAKTLHIAKSEEAIRYEERLIAEISRALAAAAGPPPEPEPPTPRVMMNMQIARETEWLRLRRIVRRLEDIVQITDNTDIDSLIGDLTTLRAAGMDDAIDEAIVALKRRQVTDALNQPTRYSGQRPRRRLQGGQGRGSVPQVITATGDKADEQHQS